MKSLRTMFAATACVSIALACAPVHAALINHHDGSFVDTRTGYVWRTLAQYDGLDFAAAASLLPGGYHVASEAELATLSAAAPATPATFALDAAAMGASDNGIIWGYYGDGTRYAWRDAFDTSWNSNAANGAGWTNWNYEVAPSTAFPGLSLFAVDTTPEAAAVPEPMSLALFGLGFLMLAGRASRKPGR